MRKSIVIATFALAGAGAVGVGATLVMAGSDTLKPVTLDLVSSFNGGAPLCTGAISIQYNGGGSGAGENAMLAGTQTVAPMSRFLATNVCKGVGGGGVTAGSQTANGLIVGLDGLAIIGSSIHAGASSCNGATGGTTASSCSVDAGVPIDQAHGLAFNTTVSGSFGTYTFQNWKDVLRVLYMGKDNTGAVNCNSALRNYLASNWTQVFEDPGGCTGCTTIRHLWRRDDASGTTDIFSQLLGFGGPSATGGSQVAAAVGTYYFGSDNLCNAAVNNGFTSGTTATGWGATLPGENGGAEQGTTSGGTTTVQAGIVPNDDQDHDPIRVLCAGSGTSGRVSTEQVCERLTYNPNAATVSVASNGSGGVSITLLTGGSGYLSTPTVNINGGGCATPPQATATLSGSSVSTITVNSPGTGCATLPSVDLDFYQGTLGLVLPIITTNTLGADQYHTNGCSGSSSAISAPLVPSVNSRGSVVLVGGNCPNGDPSINSGNQCTVPFDTTQSPATPNCLANAGQTPSSSSSTSQGGTGIGPNPQTADGRVYNLWVYKNAGTATAPVWVVANDDSNRPLYGAYYRIHSTLPYTLGATACAVQDSTLQIGCLTQSDQCTFGYAGKEGAAQPGATALKIFGVPPVVACIQALGNPNVEYPISRKLYLDTIAGFQNASTAEQALAACEGNAGPNAGSVLQAILNEDFVPLPDAGPNAINGGNSICEDFNEHMLCDAGLVNGNACDAGAGVTGISVTTTCGNGVKEAFEDCDPADPVSTAACPNSGAGCSTTCRCN